MSSVSSYSGSLKKAKLESESSSSSAEVVVEKPTSSLDILMPGYKMDIFCCGTQRPKPTTSALELEKNSRAVIESINNRSFKAPKELVASNYKSDIDELPKTTSYEENEQDFRKVAEENPEYQIEIVDVCADVDEDTGFAIVYCLLSVTGRPANVTRQSVSVVEWQRRNGSWQYYNASVIRGQDGIEIPGARHSVKCESKG